MTKLTQANVFEYITLLRMNFPGAYACKDEAQEAVLISSWYGILSEYPKEMVDVAVRNALRKAKSVPYIGHINAECEALMTAELPTPAELWAGFEKALANTADNLYYLNDPYLSKGAWREIRSNYDNLPAESKAFIGTLRSFMQMAGDKSGWRYEKSRFIANVSDVRCNLMRKPDYRANLLVQAENSRYLLGGGSV